MTKRIEAVYENRVLRPLEPLPLDEHQRVTVTVTESPADPLGAFFDHEYMDGIKTEVAAMEHIPSQEEIQAITSKDPTSWAEAIIAEREDRL